MRNPKSDQEIIDAFNKAVTLQDDFWTALREFELLYGRDVEGLATADLNSAADTIDDVEEAIEAIRGGNDDDED